MTVKELIEELEAIEDKNLLVVVFNKLDFYGRLYANRDIKVFEDTEYSWTGYQRNRIVIG